MDEVGLSTGRGSGGRDELVWEGKGEKGGRTRELGRVGGVGVGGGKRGEGSGLVGLSRHRKGL